MITYKKRLIRTVGSTPALTLVRLQDFVTPYSYCGLAPTGSTESQNVWDITRIEVFMDGTISTAIATGISWDDRYIAVYN
jgi:hypothetical protein